MRQRERANLPQPACNLCPAAENRPSPPAAVTATFSSLPRLHRCMVRFVWSCVVASRRRTYNHRSRRVRAARACTRGTFAKQSHEQLFAGMLRSANPVLLNPMLMERTFAITHSGVSDWIE